MTYNTFADFRPDFEAVQQAGMSFHKVAKVMPNVAADMAWNLYVNTKRAPLGFQVFGRHIIDQAERIELFKKAVPSGGSGQMPKFMQGLTDVEFTGFGKTNDEESGSALKISNNKWNFTVNDTWVLAGVHAYQPFYPASPVISANIFHNNFVLTITGRELVGLALAGYKQHKTAYDSIGTIYEPGARSAADKANLVDYQVAISKLKSVADAKSFFEKAGIVIPEMSLA
jgi:hypothetical protein